MKKILYFLMILLLFVTLVSCNETSEVVDYESLGGETMSLYVGQTGEFEEGYTYHSLNSDVLELNGNNYRSLKQGNAVVVVKQGNTKIGVYLVAVYGSEPVVLEELNITNNPQNLEVAQNYKLEYEKDPIDANDYEALVWSSSNPEIATIDKSGNITPLKPGNVIFTLTAINSEVKKDVNVTILPRETIFELNYDSIVGVSGTSEAILEPSVLTDYSYDGTITWFTEDSSIVEISQTGKLTFKETGTTNVGIKATIDGKLLNYKCEVTVLADLGYKIIRTPEELQNIRNISGDYMLGNDIDMSFATSEGGALYNEGKGFMPLFDNAKESFKGTFDGNGYTIYNMYINRPNEAFVALMRYISGEEGNEGVIKRLNIVGGSITGGNYTAVFYANSSGYGSRKSGLRDSYAELTLKSMGTLSCLVGFNKGVVENCIANVDYDALGRVNLFALNHTDNENTGVRNCVFVGQYGENEYANTSNGGFVVDCYKINSSEVSEFEFNMGTNWSWIKGSLPVVKGVSYE